MSSLLVKNDQQSTKIEFHEICKCDGYCLIEIAPLPQSPIPENVTPNTTQHKSTTVPATTAVSEVKPPVGKSAVPKLDNKEKAKAKIKTFKSRNNDRNR
jgi:hypothetical protein